MKRFYLLLPLLFLAGLVVARIGVRDSRMPEFRAMVGPAPLPTVTPTVTAAPGWWDETDFATPTLKKLPGAPKPKFQGGMGGGQEPGEKVPFKIISCPTIGVKITEIRTASGPWWHIFGVASIPNLWYWKAEISADGKNWASLYRSEAPVVNGVLVRLNLTTIPAEAQQIRLMAVDGTGNYPEPCVVKVGQR
jgi:hypothetical protein